MIQSILDSLEKNRTLKIRVKPSSPKTEIREYDKNKDSWKINVSAIPEKNKANIAIIKFFKKKYKKDIKIISGLTSRDKTIKVL